MAVEEAQHVMAGDHIHKEDGGPLVEVLATVHSSEEVLLTVFNFRLGIDVLELLPDDPVFVAIYSDDQKEEDY